MSAGAEVDIKAFEAAIASLGGGTIEMLIGFNADYAAAVHERLDLHHDQGQAKFLEAAIQHAQTAGLLQKSVMLEVSRCASPAEIPIAVMRGVLKAGLQIIGDAQELAPVLTGFLKASGTWHEPELVK